MTLQQTDVDGVRVLRLAGSLTQDAIREMMPDFSKASPPGSRVVVDLTNVDLMTTPAIAMLLAADKDARQTGGRIVLTGTYGLVDDLLRRCRLDAVLTIAATHEDAVRVARA